jgi:alpha-L-rhamnosidase
MKASVITSLLTGIIFRKQPSEHPAARSGTFTPSFASPGRIRLMKTAIIVWAGALAFVAPALDGGASETRSRPSGEASRVPGPQWRAQWIWLPAGEPADMLLARKALTLTSKPARAVLSVTASSRYELYVNSKYIGSGPARCAPHHQSFDMLDIASALQPGQNVVAIRVHHQREATSYYDGSRAGLLAQLDVAPDTPALRWQTDASWRVSPDRSWQNAAPKMARFHLEVADRMDLRQRVSGWTGLDFDDREWVRARVLQRETGWPSPQANERATHLTPPWTSLFARDIPYLSERAVTVGAPVQNGSVSANAADFSGEKWIDAPAIARIPVKPSGGAAVGKGAPLVISANAPREHRVLIYDLGEVHNGRPYLELAGPAGAVVDIMCAPYLLDGVLESPIVFSHYVDRIVLSGQRERWDAFYLKPARWLAVVFRHLPGETTVFGAGLTRTEYPFVRKGSFQTPDFPELSALWDAAAKTIQVCTTDAYTDNYRERRQYAQTAYYAGLGNYAVFGDHALQRRYLKQIAEEQLADGLMPAYAPRHGEDFMVILDSNCFWIRGLHQYLLYSGDHATTRELLPAARKLLELLQGCTNADGLIDSPPHPYWLDHALIDRRGANFCLNAHYLGALEDFAQVLQWLDAPQAELYRQRAARVRAALRERLWDPAKRLFADALVNGERSDQFSEHGNAMALALKIATPEQQQAVAAQLRTPDRHDFVRRASGLVMVTPAMSHFLLAGLCEAGQADAAWGLAQARFGHMMAPGTNGTLWEEWWLTGSGRTGTYNRMPSGRSDAQTESAFFPGLFSRYILGIEPTQPGLRDVVLRYYPSSRLFHRRGAIPTPSGLLEVAWDVSPTQFVLTLQAPTQTTIRLDLASLGLPSPDRIGINGRPPSNDQFKDGMMFLPAGRSVVRVVRQ